MWLAYFQQNKLEAISVIIIGSVLFCFGSSGFVCKIHDSLLRGWSPKNWPTWVKNYFTVEVNFWGTLAQIVWEILLVKK